MLGDTQLVTSLRRLQAWRVCGVEGGSAKKIKSHQALDELENGSSVRDVLQRNTLRRTFGGFCH